MTVPPWLGKLFKLRLRCKRRTLVRLGLIAFGLGAGILALYAVWARTYDLKHVGAVPERSLVFSVDGEVYSRVGMENRVVVPLKQVSKDFIQALLAREDTRFYQHHGLDYRGIGRAIVHDVASLSLKEGGSTLTQQLARNSFRLGTFSPHRKLLEAMIARRIEAHYSKEQILEHYVNRIYFGAGVYGIETASQIYFGRPNSELTLSQAALLAGIIRSPNRFSPFRNYPGALAQRDAVLERMVKLGMITQAAAGAARSRSVGLVQKHPMPLLENYAMDALWNEMETCISQEQMDQGGLRIYSTIDPQLQELAVKVLETHLTEIENQKKYPHPKKTAVDPSLHEGERSTTYLQGALVAINNRTGGICALVGGRDYRDSKYNRALFALRPVGSTFKPFVYAAAFENGLSPDDEIDDSPLRAGEVSGASTSWMPANSDKKYLGEQEAEYGLIHSRNTMSIRVGERVGVEGISDLASLVGLGKEIPRVPAIYLGAFETTLRRLTTAYTVFSNRGILKPSYIIEKIVDSSGSLIYEANNRPYPVLDEEAVEVTSELLEKAIDEGTGKAARSLGFDKRGGGKTGTTGDYHDAWFVGYTSSLTCGVWVGFDQPKTIMEKGYGATLALPIWASVMARASDRRYPDSGYGEIATNEMDSKSELPTRKSRDTEKTIADTFLQFGDDLENFFTGKRRVNSDEEKDEADD